jgi:hypothetical protein
LGSCLVFYAEPPVQYINGTMNQVLSPVLQKAPVPVPVPVPKLRCGSSLSLTNSDWNPMVDYRLTSVPFTFPFFSQKTQILIVVPNIKMNYRPKFWVEFFLRNSIQF